MTEVRSGLTGAVEHMAPVSIDEGAVVESDQSPHRTLSTRMVSWRLLQPACAPRKALREDPKRCGPTTLATHRFVKLLPTCAVTFEMAMFEFHARSVGAF